MSTSSAGLAGKLGYSSIKVMLKGAPGWKKAGQKLVASNDFVANGNAIILDLRPAPAAASGHIKGAVNIPAAELAEAEDNFPPSKAAPFVLYGEPADIKMAMKTLKDWGYKSISLVEGGLIGWQAAGNTLVTGPAASEINWVRKLEEGEVGLDDFNKVAAGKGTGRIILDVRNLDETADGMFSGAINIPLDELDDRLTELPKDKEILVHCSTGARAEMAHQTLKKSGLTSLFLVATVECEEGICTAEE
ncbi:MAG: rhodanese [Proteobacteria bacterium]|nr:rhodanese [Pseudomonadota bacterium]MBU1686761.1 rhodanese [Pseudomonadota bacterium]